MKSLFSIIQGWVRLKGDTDGTFIGNDADSLKTKVTSSALPDGGSTSAKQDSQITQATNTNTKLDTLNSNGAKETKQDTQITNQTTLNTRVGDLTETAPASDTASSGLNGRLQRIAQRISTFITGLTNGTYQIKLRGNTDGTNIGNVSDSLKTKVTSPVSGLDASVTLANTTAVLAKVGATNLSGRTYVTLYAITKNVFWGYNTNCNFPLPIGSLIFVPANALCNVYVKTDNATPPKTVVVGES